MAAKKGSSVTATLFHGVGFLLAAILVLHIVFELTHFPAQPALVASVKQAAVPLSLFFRGLVDAPTRALQVLVDFGLAAAFWVLVGGILARVFG